MQKKDSRRTGKISVIWKLGIHSEDVVCMKLNFYNEFGTI